MARQGSMNTTVRKRLVLLGFTMGLAIALYGLLAIQMFKADGLEVFIDPLQLYSRLLRNGVFDWAAIASMSIWWLIGLGYWLRNRKGLAGWI